MSDLRVALTFDAEHPDRSRCPAGNHDRVVDALDRAGVRATFFLQGRWVSAYPETARRIVSGGHLIGNHSDHHARMPLYSDEGVRTDVRDAERTIRELAGADSRPWFRCPFGAGHDDPRILRLLGEVGYRNVHWDVDAEDWEEKQTVGEVERLIVERTLGRGDGAIVLLHTWPEPTLSALPAILGRLRSEGAEFVTVQEGSRGAAA
jgi:peptidoglycan/xylan/chitin deacetylase (PgdA/CDA1 family)